MNTKIREFRIAGGAIEVQGYEDEETGEARFYVSPMRKPVNMTAGELLAFAAALEEDVANYGGVLSRMSDGEWCNVIVDGFVREHDGKEDGHD